MEHDDDPYLRPARAPTLAGIAPDLTAVLRARRDRALAREAARRAAAEARRRRPDDLRRLESDAIGADGRVVMAGVIWTRVTPSTVQRRSYTPAILPREDALPRTGRGVITMVRSS